MQPALSTRNRRLFNRRPSLLWKIRKVVQKYSIIIAFLPRHHKPQLLTPNRAARHCLRQQGPTPADTCFGNTPLPGPHDAKKALSPKGKSLCYTV